MKKSRDGRASSEILSQVQAGIIHRPQSTSKVRNAITSFLNLLQTGVKKDWCIENVGKRHTAILKPARIIELRVAPVCK